MESFHQKNDDDNSMLPEENKNDNVKKSWSNSYYNLPKNQKSQE